MDDLINILLVDDEPRNLDTLQAVLDDPAYRLLRASDADTALHLLLQHDVAAIVLDIKMPGVSGFEQPFLRSFSSWLQSRSALAIVWL